MRNFNISFRWQHGVVLLLLIVNFVLIMQLFPATTQAEETTEDAHRTIRRLYILTEGLGSLKPEMEIMTVHGSIQYYTDDTDWLYFEQMAGSLSITLGADAQRADYWDHEENGIQYRCVSEALGSELIWEDENGYMFYLYSSLDSERLLEISKGLVCRQEGAAP